MVSEDMVNIEPDGLFGARGRGDPTGNPTDLYIELEVDGEWVRMPGRFASIDESVEALHLMQRAFRASVGRVLEMWSGVLQEPGRIVQLIPSKDRRSGGERE